MKDSYKWPFPEKPHPLWWKVLNPITINVVGSISKFWLKYCSRTKVYHINRLYNTINKTDRPVITIANHHSCVDDPLLFGILTYKQFNSPNMRWSVGASDICFTKKHHAYFFGCGQVIPVVRGDGVFQRGMDYAIEKLNNNGWVHVFPEARVNMDKTFIRFKWGVGRLIDECKKIPVVVPIYHLGMDSVMPNKRPYIPQFNKKLTIIIGESIDFTELLVKLRDEGKSAEEIRQVLTQKLQDAMEQLKIEATSIHNTRI